MVIDHALSHLKEVFMVLLVQYICIFFLKIKSKYNTGDGSKDISAVP